jgi:hypothetical protein
MTARLPTAAALEATHWELCTSPVADLAERLESLAWLHEHWRDVPARHRREIEAAELELACLLTYAGPMTVGKVRYSARAGRVVGRLP